MTTEEAIAYWEVFQREIDLLYPLCDVRSKATLGEQREPVALALSALCAQQQAEANKPLTLDELRKMEGEPVWCEIRIKGKPPFYGIVHGENVTGFIHGDDKPVNLAITHVGAYGLAWLAYRHKTEEVQG